MLLTPQQFREMISYLRTGPGDADRRTSERVEVQATAVVTPLTSGGKGDSFTVMTRDISRGGLGLLSTVALKPDQQVIVKLPGDGPDGVHVVGTVKHCKTIAGGLYSHGVQFTGVADREGMQPPPQHRGLEAIAPGSRR